MWCVYTCNYIVCSLGRFLCHVFEKFCHMVFVSMASPQNFLATHLYRQDHMDIPLYSVMCCNVCAAVLLQMHSELIPIHAAVLLQICFELFLIPSFHPHCPFYEGLYRWKCIYRDFC